MQTYLIKISGESLSDNEGIASAKKINSLVKQIKEISKNNKIAIVIGGGNIWRGARNGLKISRPISDTIGMVATCINATILSESLNANGVNSKIFSPKQCAGLTNDINYSEINAWLSKKGNVVIFASGTGSPYFTTDSGAALRASEINAKWILMAKNNVDGVYDDDPHKNKHAKFYNNLNYDEIIEKNLKVMDLTALTICKENKIKIKVFNASKEDCYINAIKNKIKCSIIE